jgi:hypothetical protein
MTAKVVAARTAMPLKETANVLATRHITSCPPIRRARRPSRHRVNGANPPAPLDTTAHTEASNGDERDVL